MAHAQWSIPAVAADVSRARRAVLEFAVAHDVPDPPIADLRLVLAESMSNAVMHAYDTQRPGTITVRLAIDAVDRRLTVGIADDGAGLAHSDTPGAGFGFLLMRASAGAFDIRPAAGGGTEVTVSFAFAEAG